MENDRNGLLIRKRVSGKTYSSIAKNAAGLYR